MAICWERALPLAFHLCCFIAVLAVCVPFPFGVWGRLWNSIVSVPNHSLFIYFLRTRFRALNWRIVLFPRKAFKIYIISGRVPKGAGLLSLDVKIFLIVNVVYFT